MAVAKASRIVVFKAVALGMSDAFMKAFIRNVLNNPDLKAYRGICDQCVCERSSVGVESFEVVENQGKNAANFAVERYILLQLSSINFGRRWRLLVKPGFFATMLVNAA